jgi:uncharacterized protein
MPRPPITIALTPAQRALIREATGKDVPALGVESVETGSGFLYTRDEQQFWLLKHSDLASYRRAQRRRRPRIDPTKAKFQLRIGRSRIHRWGVFADERIPARRNVIEYCGELVNPVEGALRVKDTEATYLFGVDEFWRIDGSMGGSGAECINHSCDPNLRWHGSGQRVVCRSIRPIAAGEELTLDYHFYANAPRVVCRCGSPKCRGTINTEIIKHPTF